MLSAIIKNGSKQIKISEGQEIFVEKLPLNLKDEHEFKEILAITGEKTILGTPFIKDAKVKAEVIKQGRSKKIIVFKYKSKKKYRCKQGHRQSYTKLLIKEIIVPN